jgi:hypothetical protein
MAIKSRLKHIIRLAAVAGLMAGVKLAEIATAQSATEESLNYLVNILMNRTLEKFDAIFCQGKVVTGEIKNSELSFRLEGGQVAAYKASEIAALVLEAGKGEVIFRSKKKLSGQLLNALEITLAGFEAQKVSLAPEVLEIAIFRGQLRPLISSAEFGARFQELLIDNLQRSIAKHDVLALKNDGILTGTVTNPVFQIDDLYFNKETIAEIIFGSPDQLRTRSGQVVTGTIRNPMVTLKLLSEEMRSSFNTSTLARIFFIDTAIEFAPEGERGKIQVTEG